MTNIQKQVYDQLGRGLMVPDSPKRIISLCPSLTDTLYALGLFDRIVGRTRYCIHPHNLVDQVAKVGGTKEVDYERIAALSPDLILAEKEENPKEMVEKLTEKYPVYVTNVETIEDAYKMILDIGFLTSSSEKAIELVQDIQYKFRLISPIKEFRVAYFIWRKPYMVVGNHTFIHSMLEQCGFSNVFKDHPDRYPTVTIEEIQQAAPDVLLLSSEPFPFSEKHLQEFASIVPHARILLVDGEIFSWYGSHMLEAPKYINQFLQQLREE